MPASFSVSSGDYRWLIGKMRELDKEIFNQMRRDFRGAIRPFSRSLAQNIPSKAPVSGLSPNNPRSRQSLDQRAPYVWKKPSAQIDVGSRVKARRRGLPTEAVVRIRFADKRPNAAFSVLERGQNGRLPAQVAKSYPFGDRGRWVIPQFYRRQDEMVTIAKGILLDYARRFNRLVARRFD